MLGPAGGDAAKTLLPDDPANATLVSLAGVILDHHSPFIDLVTYKIILKAGQLVVQILAVERDVGKLFTRAILLLFRLPIDTLRSPALHSRFLLPLRSRSDSAR